MSEQIRMHICLHVNALSKVSWECHRPGLILYQPMIPERIVQQFLADSQGSESADDE